MVDTDKEWEARSDLSTLVEAKKIMAEPKRRAAAMKEKRVQQAALANLEKKDK